MKCAIMQPTYNPWIGYFDLIDKVDVFIFLDNVQLVRRSWQVRNRIKTQKGELFLTIPIRKTKPREELTIKDAEINDDENWRYKHIKAIEYNYRKSPHFEEVFPLIRSLIDNNLRFLADFNINLITTIARRIGIRTPFVRASDLGKVEGKKDVLLVNICKKMNCSEYISPRGSAVYIESQEPGGFFAKNSINLFYHSYEHPVYSQLYGSFLPYMGVFDLLLNEGFEKALEIIKRGRRHDIHYLEFRDKHRSGEVK